MLMSATSNAEVERLQKLVLQNPVTLNLLRPDQDDARSGGAAAGPGSAAEIEHFSVHCDRWWSSFACETIWRHRDK